MARFHVHLVNLVILPIDTIPAQFRNRASVKSDTMVSGRGLPCGCDQEDQITLSMFCNDWQKSHLSGSDSENAISNGTPFRTK